MSTTNQDDGDDANIQTWIIINGHEDDFLQKAIQQEVKFTKISP